MKSYARYVVRDFAKRTYHKESVWVLSFGMCLGRQIYIYLSIVYIYIDTDKVIVHGQYEHIVSTDKCSNKSIEIRCFAILGLGFGPSKIRSKKYGKG